MTDILVRGKQFLKQNLEKLQKQHPGKYVLIQGAKIHGAFETYDAGVEYGVDNLKGTPFLVRNVMSPEDQPVYIPVIALGLPLTYQS